MSTMGEPGIIDADLVAWVENWLSPIIRRPITSNHRWCPRWWAHPEAVARLTALWLAWKAADQAGGTAPSTWWLTTFAPHWTALTAPSGPFAACSPGHDPTAEPHCSSAGRLPVEECPRELKLGGTHAP